MPKAYARQNKFLKIIKKNCRVPSVRHSAKSDGRCPPSRAGHLLPSGTFAECRGTRQSLDLPRARLCRVHGARQSHLCRVLDFAECGTRQNFSLPSVPIKSTRQSLRHSAKSSFPVVFVSDCECMCDGVSMLGYKLSRFTLVTLHRAKDKKRKVVPSGDII